MATAADPVRIWLERLAAIDRGSCSPGEHEAAELIAGALREQGATVAVQHPRVHGTYWWPLGLTSALGIAGAALALRGRRAAGAGLAAAGAGLVIDDLSAGRRWLRRVLPKRATATVVAETGDAGAAEALLVVAHHDAAHSGVFFNPRLTEVVGQRMRWGASASPGGRRRAPALMLPIAGGPALVAAAAAVGARRPLRLGAMVCAGIIASFADIARRPTVPGANDNLTGVVTLLELARALRERPVRGLRVLLVSTGAEEALMEGMRAFAAGHFPQFDPARTRVLCVDTLGSPHLVLAEAEGMLQVRPYDSAFKDLIATTAQEAGIRLRRGMTMRLGTDGYLALRHGLPAAMLMSVDDYGVASNYHWPTDTPDRVNRATLRAAIDLCERVVRRLAEDSPA